MHPVGKNVRNVCFEFEIEIEIDHYGVPDRFVPEQNRHFLNDVVDVHHRTFRGCAFFVERPQTVDNINCTVSVLLNSGCCCAGPLQMGGSRGQASTIDVCINNAIV